MRVSFVLEMDNADAVDDVPSAIDSFESVLAACRDARSADPELTCELTIVMAAARHAVVEAELLPRARLAGVFDDVGVVVAPNTTYYEKKMLGALKSGGDVIAYVDSDVTYGTAWLSQVLAPFMAGDVDVVYGCTYARTGTANENAAAIVWQFSLDDRRDPRYTDTGMIWSNNWLVRRDYLLGNPLPRVSGDLKLEGSLWDREVRGRGALVRHVATKAYHVQPATAGALFELGCRSGRSNVVGARRDGQALSSVLHRWLRHNGVRTTTDRARRLHGVVAFSFARVALLQLVSFAGLGWGIALESVHPRRTRSDDYTTLASGVTRV